MKVVNTDLKSEGLELNGDTPTMRLFALLEVIAAKDQRHALQDLVEETGLPKPNAQAGHLRLDRSRQDDAKGVEKD